MVGQAVAVNVLARARGRQPAALRRADGCCRLAAAVALAAGRLASGLRADGRKLLAQRRLQQGDAQQARQLQRRQRLRCTARAAQAPADRPGGQQGQACRLNRAGRLQGREGASHMALARGKWDRRFDTNSSCRCACHPAQTSQHMLTTR